MDSDRSHLKSAWDEIKSGRNIDVYLAVILVITVPVLYLIFPVYMSDKLNQVILAVLAAILISNLSNKSLLKKITTPTDAKLINSINEAGLQIYYPTRIEENFRIIINNAQVKFDSIGTSLPDISFDRCADVLKNKLQQNPKFEVRILLLNPYLLIANEKKWSNVYKDGKKDIIGQIEKSINDFLIMRNELIKEQTDIKNRFDVRLYSLIPTVSCVFNEDILDIAFYDEYEPASKSPAWKFKKNENNRGIYNYYQNNFEIVWNDKKTISIFKNKKLLDQQRELYRSVRANN